MRRLERDWNYHSGAWNRNLYGKALVQVHITVNFLTDEGSSSGQAVPRIARMVSIMMAIVYPRIL